LGLSSWKRSSRSAPDWLILVAILFALEPMALGIFLMWFGVAAVSGLIVFRYEISWQWQLIWFCGLSLAKSSA
jgi:inner membrane protein